MKKIITLSLLVFVSAIILMGITSFVCNAKCLPYGGNNPFDGVPPKEATSVIPMEVKRTHQSSPIGGDFGTILEDERDIEKSMVTMTTTLPMGSPITILALNSDYTSPTIEGVHEDEEQNLIVDSPTIILHGDIASLMISDCHLSQLDVTKAPNLTVLFAAYNQLTELDLSQSPLLESIILAHNELHTVKWTEMPNLTALYIYNTPLSQIDLKGFPMLSELSISNTKIKEVNLTENRELTKFYGAGLALKSIDLSNNFRLDLLDLCGNALSRLDIAGLSQLKELYIYINNLSSKAMEEIVNALPQRLPVDNALIMAIDTKAPEEGNEFEDEFISITSSKNWNVYDYAGGINDGKGEPYTAIGKIFGESDVKIVVQDACLYISGGNSGSLVKLYSLTGTLLYSKPCSSEGDCRIDLTYYPEGSYLVSVDDRVEFITLTHKRV